MPADPGEAMKTYIFRQGPAGLGRLALDAAHVRAYNELVVDMRIAEIAAGDLEHVVAVHRAAFPRAALTGLGPEAVRRYYLWQLTGPHEMYASAAWVGARMAGFCFGGVCPTSISGFLAENKLYLACRVLTHPWLFANPLFRGRLRMGLKILENVSGRAQPPEPREMKRSNPGKPFDILSIAVHPDLQGTGVGKLLLLNAERQAGSNGFQAMTLVVSCDNDQAIRFYEHLGWKRAKQNGVWRGRMEKWLKAAPSQAFA